MGSSLDSKKVDELLDKYRALAAKEQRRLNELEERDAHLVAEVCTSLTVTGSAFGMGYLRGYLGEKANIWGIPIDAGVACLFHGLAACLGFSLNKGAQKVGKFFHDLANGALASWTSTIGADLGEQKRKAQPAPAPAPQPNTGAVAPVQETLTREFGPVTQEELAVATAAMGLKMQPTMPQRPAPPAPPIPAEQTANPLPETEAAAATNAQTESAPATSSNPPKPYRFTHRGGLDTEAEVRAILQSLGAPALPDLKASLLWLSEQSSLEKLDPILRWAGIPT